MIKEHKLYKLETSLAEVQFHVHHPTTFGELHYFTQLEHPFFVYFMRYSQQVTNSDVTCLLAIYEYAGQWHYFSASQNGLEHAVSAPLLTQFARFFHMRPTVFQLAKAAHLQQVSNFVFLKRKSDEFLRTFEESEIRCLASRKYGIVYQKTNQVSDEEILYNTGDNPAFDCFCNNLGVRVRLEESFKGYTGGLDIKGRQGDLLYRQIDDLEVAAHVATWLKHVPTDQEQVEKKRHIGNDNLVVVYQNQNAEFDPGEFRSQMIYVFLVVQQNCTDQEAIDLDAEGKCKFKVTITYRKYVKIAGKAIPKEYEQGEEVIKEEFYRWLIFKVLDIINGFYDAGELQAKMQRHRQSLINQVATEKKE